MYPPRYFENLCELEGNPRCVEDIRKDLHRQFPYHEIFMEQEGHGLVVSSYTVIGDQTCEERMSNGLLFVKTGRIVWG